MSHLCLELTVTCPHPLPRPTECLQELHYLTHIPTALLSSSSWTHHPPSTPVLPFLGTWEETPFQGLCICCFLHLEFFLQIPKWKTLMSSSQWHLSTLPLKFIHFSAFFLFPCFPYSFHHHLITFLLVLMCVIDLSLLECKLWKLRVLLTAVSQAPRIVPGSVFVK